MKTKNLGIYKNNKDGWKKTTIDISGRDIWLVNIQHAKARNSWDLIFRVNCGKGEGKAFRCDENYIMVINVRPDTNNNDSTFKELCKTLKEYPILNFDELALEFKQRGYFEDAGYINIKAS